MNIIPLKTAKNPECDVLRNGRFQSFMGLWNLGIAATGDGRTPGKRKTHGGPWVEKLLGVGNQPLGRTFFQSQPKGS
jgi:hypothetical protein